MIVSNLSIKLANFRIGHRIGILATIALIGIATIAALSYFNFKSIERSEASYADGANLKILTEEIGSSALNMRRAEKDFLLRKDMKYAERYENYKKTMLSQLGQVSKFTTDDQVLTVTQELSELGQKHAAQFSRISNLYQEIGLVEDQGLEGKLRKNVHAIEGLLNDLDNNTALIVKMLMMRRSEKDFIMRQDSKYVARLDRYKNEFSETLSRSRYGASTKKELGEKLASYAAAFEAYAGMTLQFNGELGKLSQIYSDMGPRFKQISEHAVTTLDVHSTEMQDVRSSAIKWVGIFSLVILVLVSIISWFLVRSITVPLLVLQSSVENISSGNYDNVVPGQQRGDELGTISCALDNLRVSAKERVRLEKESAEQAKEKVALEAAQLKAESDRAIEERERISEESQIKEHRTQQIQTKIEAFDTDISGALGELNSASETMGMTSTQLVEVSNSMDDQAADVARETGKTNESVQTVASAMEEFSASILEISSQVVQASQLSEHAMETLTSGGEAIQELSETSQKIGDVVSLISDIASQTNLLALNATIESARAGEAGKGFAVVAGEVKNLASETEKATDEIDAQITGMQQATQSAVSAIEQINSVVLQLNQVMVTISSAIEEQNSATQEINRSINFAAQGTEQVAIQIGNVTEAAKNTQNYATDVQVASKSLDTISQGIRKNVETFLKDIGSI